MTDTVPPGSFARRPLPAPSDWRKALDVYVAGKSRALTNDEKRRLGGRADAEGDAAMTRAGSTRPSKVVYGVGVPPVFDYYRNASTWRNRLPEPKSRGETTADV